MKHMVVYENFDNSELVEEGAIRKFFTGHSDKNELSGAKSKILDDIESNIQKLVDSGDILPEKVTEYKQRLINQAKENNWKGRIVIRQSKASGKYFVMYDDGTSGLQNLGSAAGSATTKRW